MSEIKPYSGLIFACQPAYGNGDPSSHCAFWAMMTRNDSPLNGRIIPRSRGGSLLASTFNDLYCEALNFREVGNPVTYFAMLHDDVTPAYGWLDILFEDIEKTGADLVAAAVPIKDVRGLSSTAIDDPSDIFQVERRITMDEVGRLPDVFDAADCGYPDRLLLANTGCWICRLDRPWNTMTDAAGALKCYFTIKDVVRKDIPGKTDDGRDVMLWQKREAPEDWNFSRFVGQCGGKVMVTKRVKLTHRGECPYRNDQYDWGDQKVDENLRYKFKDKKIGTVPVLPKIAGVTLNGKVDGVMRKRGKARSVMITEDAKGFVFPKDVRGWLTVEEGKRLFQLAKDKVVLELGSYCGRSTVCLGQSALSVTTVDHHEGDAWSGRHDTHDEFKETIKKYKLENVEDIDGSFEEVLPTLEAAAFDLAFIDGAHDEASTRTNLKLVLPLMRPDGVIAFHDFHYLPVRQAVREVFPDEENEHTQIGVTAQGIVVESLMWRPVRTTERVQENNGNGYSCGQVPAVVAGVPGG